jgi:hypothetical protein
MVSMKDAGRAEHVTEPGEWIRLDGSQSRPTRSHHPSRAGVRSEDVGPERDPAGPDLRPCAAPVPRTGPRTAGARRPRGHVHGPERYLYDHDNVGLPTSITDKLFGRIDLSKNSQYLPFKTVRYLSHFQAAAGCLPGPKSSTGEPAHRRI